jgi:outer membrane protein OmpA-like peptidoglycan-associated protein
MAEDWSVDVRKYAPNADSGVIAGIVHYCGIALQNRDSSLVSFNDEAEVGRVRENFLKKKLGLTNSDAELNQAIAAVGERMKPDHTRNRVTVYYLLTEHFRKLSVFGGVDAVAGAGLGAAAAAAAATARPANTERPAAPVFVGVAAPAAPARSMRWLVWLLLALLLLLLLWWFLSHRPAPPPPVTSEPPPPVASAPAAPPVTVGLMTKVYFATASSTIPAESAPALAAAAEAIKKDDLKVAITGYTDKTGDLAANQELAKNRAKAMHDALTAAGVPDANIEMRPPVYVEIGAAGGDDPEARRVELTKQ